LQQPQLMIKFFRSGWTTKSFTTVCGTLLFLGSFLHGSVASNPSSEATLQQQAPADEVPTVPIANDRTAPDRALNEKALSSTSEPAISLPSLPTGNTRSDTPILATVQSYPAKDKVAVILRVRNIPVLTFFGAPGELFSSPTQSDPTPSQVFSQASAIADRINALVQDPNFDARQISVSWNKASKSYHLKIAKEVLVSLNSSTVLSETNKSRGIDALQATNRLRRLLGDAAPLKAIALESAPKSGLQDESIKTAIPLRQTTVGGGMASWYGPGFHGRLTANGERYNQGQLTAAHRSLPFNTKVRVTNLRNGQSVVVRINDRGPFSRGRVIDLSAGAARSIGVFSSGVAPVQLEVLNTDR